MYKEEEPFKKSYTYESKHLKVKSRIDFFLMSNAKSVLIAGTVISVAPNHKAVRLKLKISNNIYCTPSPGLWKFNNALLEDENYVNLINDNYPKIKEKYINIKGHVTRGNFSCNFLLRDKLQERFHL